jgi:peptidoglycan/LPS O-acetylase OafA/YrhL
MIRPPGHQCRLGAFDLLRFLAAAMVVCLHHGLWDAMSVHSPLSVAPPLASALAYGKFGVDVFFIISGYFVFLTADGRGWMDFCIARISRIYPALFVFCTVSFVVITAWGTLPASDTPHLRNYLGNISLASFVTAFLPGFSGAAYVEGVYWTLAYEFVWYALVVVFLVRGTVANAQPFLAMLTVASVALWAVLWAGINEKIGQIGQYLPYFLLGAQMYLLAGRPPTLGGWVCFWANAVLVGVSVYFRAVGGMVHVQHVLLLDPLVALAIVAASVVIMALAASGRLRIGGALVTALGASTYPLYLMHDRAGVVLAQHVPWLRGLTGLLLLLLFLVVVAICFAAWIEPWLIAAMRATLRRLTGCRRPPRTFSREVGPGPG